MALMLSAVHVLCSELQRYQFLETDYNKAAFTLTNDKTTASYVGPDDRACLAMTRPLGRDHMLILKIIGVGDFTLNFTTCDTASLLANDQHLNKWCGAGRCSGRMATHTKVRGKLSGDHQLLHIHPVLRLAWFVSAPIEAVAHTAALLCSTKPGPGSQLSIRRTTANRIEVVVSNANGYSSTNLLDMDVTADVPVVPVVRISKKQKLQILPDEAGLQSVLSQINAFACFGAPSLLESGLSTDRTNQVNVLKSEIQEKEQQIRELLQEVKNMKEISPPIACHDVDSSSWLSNDFVSAGDSVIQRTGDIDQMNYSFRSTPLAVGTTITFMISGVAKLFGKSLTFGVTVISPDLLDMQSMPTNGSQWKLDITENWHVANDFVSTPTQHQMIRLMRTSDGILMKTANEFWMIEERLLFPVDPSVRLYPFFLFDGCVQAIQLKEFKLLNRTGVQ